MEKSEDFQVGDVVKLKSGWQAMTIHELADDGQLREIKGAVTRWFDDAKLQSHWFPLAVLTKDLSGNKPHIKKREQAPPRPIEVGDHVIFKDHKGDTQIGKVVLIQRDELNEFAVQTIGPHVIAVKEANCLRIDLVVMKTILEGLARHANDKPKVEANPKAD